jgi:DDE superfamily endonuclease
MMLTLPVNLTPLIGYFAPQFSKRVWKRVQVLLVGALLAPGRRTVTAALRVCGLSEEKHFQNYHRVLNRARWSSLALARRLLRLLLCTFASDGPLIIGLDDTLERRRGEKISAKGIYRDAVRSSHAHFVKASGLRWLCAMLLVDISWAGRGWALPVLTALCPSERYHQERGQRHKKLTDWARQIMKLLHRWLPDRELVFVADSSYAVITLLKHVRALNGVSLITRLRLDAALYDPAPPRPPKQNGRPRVKGARRSTLQQVLNSSATPWTPLKIRHWYGGEEREVAMCTERAVWYHTGLPPVEIRWVLIRDPQGKFEPQALLSTNLDSTPEQIIAWFVRRWTMEVTFAEARAHLGIETQRQWNDRAIARTTPALFALYSLVVLMAQTLMQAEARVVRASAWYAKEQPTFSDAIALVRRCLWSQCHFSTSGQQTDLIKIPSSLLERLIDAVCYAA